MVEAFTITIGTQIRRVQNLRLMVSKMDALITSPPNLTEASALHAQTSVTLYSRSLTGIVMLAFLPDIAKYKIGKGASYGMVSSHLSFLINSGFYSAVHKRAELHFDSLEKQMTAIESDFERSGANIAEGKVS
jgi:hypothetical protein